MALQVWLPLDNSIQNKGLNAAQVTVNGTTSYADGKLGRCLSCNGSSYWTISPLTLGAVASISFWAKTTDTSAMFYVLGATSYAHLNFWRVNSKYYLNKGDSYNNPFQKNGSDVAWHNDGNWHYYVTVFNGASCLLYVDGAYYGTAKTYAAPTCNGTNVRLAGGYNDTHTYDTNGLISDFRVYDTVISEQDIKELYWGKVLEITPQWVDKDRIMDASGFNFPFTPYNLTLENNKIKFNGSSSKIEFNGLKLTGGTVSIWFTMPAKPTVQRIIYFDPVAKMVLGFLADGNLCVRTASGARYLSTGITWGQMTHLVVGYNSSYVPQYCLVNGVQPGTGSNTNWTTGGTMAAVGTRLDGGNADWFNGTINEIKVFTTMLTVDEAKTLYDKGAVENNWTPTEPVWLRVLHHNNPKGARFTTQEDAKDKDTADQFSKLKIFFNNDDFRRADGNYEFMVKEKLESGSTEQVFRWTQTSNPTASTVTGYKLVSQTVNAGRDFGLKHNGSYALFHNGSTWWCACGSWSAFNNGIPGFGGTVLTGYLDLYVRVDSSVVLPSGYTKLEYIQSNGNQWIDTGVKACMNKIRCVCDMTPLNGNDTAFFGSRGTYYLFYKVSDNYFWPTSKCENISGTLVVGNKYHVDWNKGQLEVTGDDGVHQTASRSNSTQDSSNMYIFNFNPTDSRPTTAKLYYFDIYIDDVIVRKFIPCKRNSDNVVGLFDVVNNVFYASGSQNFIAGPAV